MPRSDPEELEAIRILRNDGWSTRKIARALHMSQTAVQRRIKELEELEVGFAEARESA